jgi:tetratricopeptide (TPR) repeat protein
MLPSPGVMSDLWTCLQQARKLAGDGARVAALGALDEIINIVARQLRSPKKGAEPPTAVYIAALCERGLLYKRMQRYDEAAADFCRAIDHWRGDPLAKLPDCILRAYLERGILHLLNLNTTQAIADFTCVIEHRPQLFEAYCERALAYRELGDASSADADLQKAKKINPDRFHTQYPFGVPLPQAQATLPDIRLGGTIGDWPKAALAEE